MTEKIEEIVARQVEAIRDLKIDKVTVWDSGGGMGGNSSTAGFLSGLIKSLPPLHEIAEMAGVELPGYLGRLAESKDKPTRDGSSSNGSPKEAPRSRVAKDGKPGSKGAAKRRGDGST